MTFNADIKPEYDGSAPYTTTIKVVGDRWRHIYACDGPARAAAAILYEIAKADGLEMTAFLCAVSMETIKLHSEAAGRRPYEVKS